MSTIFVRTPATSANLGPGFDSLGLALQLYNDLIIEEDAADWSVCISGEGRDVLPQDRTHAVVRAMQHFYDAIGRSLPTLRLTQKNAVPLTRGLGSSSTAIVSGLVGANALAGHPLSTGELVDMATALDGHPDNVTACIVGGLAVAAMEGKHVHYIRIPVAKALRAVLYIPAFEMSTPAARRQLPDAYSRGDTVFNLSRAALTAAAFATGEWEALRIGMQDRMHQPYRAVAYPQMPRLIEAALEAGARGAALSGSGPTIAAFTELDPAPIAKALEAAGKACGLSGYTLCVPVDSTGASEEVDARERNNTPCLSKTAGAS